MKVKAKTIKAFIVGILGAVIIARAIFVFLFETETLTFFGKLNFFIFLMGGLGIVTVAAMDYLNRSDRK